MTAAHCESIPGHELRVSSVVLGQVSSALVVLGVFIQKHLRMLWSLRQYFQEDLRRRLRRGTERLVESFTKHPNYDKETLANDIVVIKMKTKVGFTKFIQPLCLIHQNKNGIEEFISSDQFDI